MSYLIHRWGDAARLTGQHIEIVGVAIMAAVLVGVPAGIVATRARWLEAPVINISGVLYTIPSLALFAVLIPVLGLGDRPAIVALALYSLLVIVRNTVVGLRTVDPAAVDAARGMGMTAWERLVLVELPLALPVILAGIRAATVAGIGVATIAAYIGAGGLGVLIFDGIRTLDPDPVIAGALLASALAFAADWAFLQVEGALRRDLDAGRRAL